MLGSIEAQIGGTPLLTAEFLADPERWPTEVLTVRRTRRGGSSEIGYIFPGSPHVYVDQTRAGACYAYPSFEATVDGGWQLWSPRSLNAHAMPLRVLVVDADMHARKQTVSALGEERDVAVIGETSSGERAVMLVHDLHPDVVVIDMELSEMSGAETTATITEGWLDVAVIAFTSYEETSGPHPMIQAGAIAKLDKSELDKLPDAIRRAARVVRGLDPEQG